MSGEADRDTVRSAFGTPFSGHQKWSSKELTQITTQIIDDDEISCATPSACTAGSALNVDYCLALIRLAQLSSNVMRRLSSVRSLRLNAQAIVETVSQLQQRANAIKDEIEITNGLSLGQSIKVGQLPAHLSLEQVLYLQYAYFNALLDIHTVLACPWSRALVALQPHATFRTQVETSMKMVAETSRSAVLATKDIPVSRPTPLPSVLSLIRICPVKLAC